MSMTNPFGARSTADQVLAGVDLTGRHILLTGCSSGIGRATLNALAANGAQVIGLARSHARAESACAEAGRQCTPIECDLSDFESVAAAVQAVRALGVPLDAIITNAGIAGAQTLQTRYDVEMQFLVNHLGHFALVNRLVDLVRNRSGRIVMVSGGASIKRAPAEGVMFENLNGEAGYDAVKFYAQSKLAVALYAKELTRRLLGRGIAVNAVNPGIARHVSRHGGFGQRLMSFIAWPFQKSAAQAAATQALVAASPRAAGISGEYWADCRVAAAIPLVNDLGLAARLWDVSEQIVAAHLPTQAASLPAAA